MPTWGRSASRRARKWRETRLWEPSARRWTSRRCRPNTASCSASIRPIRSRRCPRRTVSRSRGDLPRRQTAARRPRVCDCRTRNAGGASGGPVSGKGGKASLREGRKAGLPKRRKSGKAEAGQFPGPRRGLTDASQGRNRRQESVRPSPAEPRAGNDGCPVSVPQPESGADPESAYGGSRRRREGIPDPRKTGRKRIKNRYEWLYATIPTTARTGSRKSA